MEVLQTVGVAERGRSQPTSVCAALSTMLVAPFAWAQCPQQKKVPFASIPWPMIWRRWR